MCLWRIYLILFHDWGECNWSLVLHFFSLILPRICFLNVGNKWHLSVRLWILLFVIKCLPVSNHLVGFPFTHLAWYLCLFCLLVDLHCPGVSLASYYFQTWITLFEHIQSIPMVRALLSIFPLFSLIFKKILFPFLFAILNSVSLTMFSAICHFYCF